MILPLLIGSGPTLAAPLPLAQGQARLSAPPSGDYFRPRDELHISLPTRVTSGDAGQLYLELDGVDVSALAQWRETDLLYRPLRPLTPGSHRLRVMYYAADGAVEELGYWDIDVRQSALFREVQVNGQLDLAYSQPVAEHRTSENGGFYGGGQLKANILGDNWRLRGDLDLMAVNDQRLAMTDRRVDLARFNVRAEYGRYRLTLGDQQLSAASLIQDGFERRGLSAAARLPLWDGSLSLYRGSSSQQLGIDAGLGVDEENNRLGGGRLELWPLRSDAAQVMLAAERLSGRVSAPDYGALYSGISAYTTLPVHEGNAWNLTMDGQFFQRQLRLRLEKAASEYDFDGIDYGFGAEQGRAWSALLVLKPELGTAFDWRLGLESRKLGTWYRSLAHRYAPADERRDRLFFDINTSQWHWDGGYATTDNNLSENPAYAISETRRWHFNTRYTDYAPAQGTLLALLGQPSYTLSFSGARLQDRYTPAGYRRNDLHTRRQAFTAAFTREHLQWSAGYRHDSLEDASGWQPHTRTQTTRLDTSWYPNRRYRLTVGWELQHATYPDLGVSTDRHFYTVNASAEILPQRLRCGLDIGLNQTRAEDDPFFARRNETTYFNAHLNWQIRPADDLAAGLELILSVTRNDFRNRLLPPASSEEENRVFLELRSSLPVAYPGAWP